MGKILKVGVLELVVVLTIAVVAGGFARSCVAPARADDGVPGITYSANRMACALEGIQHALERLEREKHK